MAPNLLVIAHAPQGQLAPSAAELVGLARQLRRAPGQCLRGLLLGNGLEAAGAELAGLGLDEVLLVEGPGLEHYSGPAWVRALGPLLADFSPVWVLAAQDSLGQDYAPGLSLALGAACLTGVEGLEWREGQPVLLRAGQGGKLLRRERPLTASAVLTVLPGAFPAAEPLETAAPLRRLSSAAQAPGLRHLGWSEGAGADPALAQAAAILAVGRGLGSAELLPLARELAACLGAALAGSRPVCDLGWLEYGQQVGQTGATVAPRLYLACGISGARQHTLGMQGSGYVVAVNHDPQAPMHDLADVSVIAELRQFLPALLEACRDLK